MAVKDGYVDCEPDNSLDDHSGMLDIAAGLQYSFIYNPAQDFIMSGRLVYESTSGDSDVYQGNGSGNLAPAILFLKGWDKLQFSGTVGLVLPFDTAERGHPLGVARPFLFQYFTGSPASFQATSPPLTLYTSW